MVLNALQSSLGSLADGYGFGPAGGLGVHQVLAPATRGLFQVAAHLILRSSVSSDANALVFVGS